MNLKIKRLVAREGLIILAIIALILASNILPNSHVTIDNDKPIDLLKKQRLKITDGKDKTIYTVVIDKKDLMKEKSDFGFTEADILNELGKRGSLDKAGKLNIVKKEISLVAIKEKLFLFLIFSYPLYMVFRFVFWAKNTLKEK